MSRTANGLKPSLYSTWKPSRVVSPRSQTSSSMIPSWPSLAGVTETDNDVSDENRGSKFLGCTDHASKPVEEQRSKDIEDDVCPSESERSRQSCGSHRVKLNDAYRIPKSRCRWVPEIELRQNGYLVCN